MAPTTHLVYAIQKRSKMSVYSREVALGRIHHQEWGGIKALKKLSVDLAHAGQVLQAATGFRTDAAPAYAFEQDAGRCLQVDDKVRLPPRQVQGSRHLMVKL